MVYNQITLFFMKWTSFQVTGFLYSGYLSTRHFYFPLPRLFVSRRNKFISLLICLFILECPYKICISRQKRFAMTILISVFSQMFLYFLYYYLYVPFGLLWNGYSILNCGEIHEKIIHAQSLMTVWSHQRERESFSPLSLWRYEV